MALPNPNDYRRKKKETVSGLPSPENYTVSAVREREEVARRFSDLDKGIVNAVATGFKESWEYDLLDEEDRQRKAQGLMPKALYGTYNHNDPIERYLYENGLPSNFSEAYKKTVDDYNEKTAPERQYQQVFNAIGKDVRPFLDENGSLSENKVLDYLYGNVFNSEEYKALNDEWKEKKTGTVAVGTSYEETLRDQLEEQGTYNIDKLMSDLSEELEKARMWDPIPSGLSGKTEADGSRTIKMVGTINETETQKRDSAAERAEQLKDEIASLAMQGGDIEAQQAELAELEDFLTQDETEAKEQKKAQKERWKVEDEAFKAAIGDKWPEHTTSALGAAPMLKYDEELQARVDAFREEQIANGMSPLEVDNVIRRNGLKEYINTDVVRNYATSIIAEEKGITFEQAAAEYNAMPQEEKNMFRADMQFDNRVQEDVFEEAGRALIAVPARAAMDIINSAFNFTDMANPLTPLMKGWHTLSGLEDPSEKLRETLNAVSWKLGQYGSSNNHEFINVASDVTTEIVKMYALNAAGIAAASTAAKGSALAGSVPAAEKGMGVLMTTAKKAFGTQALPFLASAMGSSYNYALEQGATRGQAAFYGLMAGAIEGSLESLGADEMINKTFSNIFVQRGKAGLSKALAQNTPKFVNLMASAIGNGVEESASYFLTGVAELAVFNPEWEFNSEEFWENMGMGALTGIVGSMATMPEGTRTNRLFSEALESGDSSMLDLAYAAHTVETMPQGKREAYGEGQALTVPEYRQAAHDKHSAIKEQDNAKKQYDAQVSSADERIMAAKKTLDDLKNRLSAVQLRSTSEISQAEQLYNEISSASNTLEKTMQSADAAKQTALKEYENRVAVLNQKVAEAERKMEAHAVAVDRTMLLAAEQPSVLIGNVDQPMEESAAPVLQEDDFVTVSQAEYGESKVRSNTLESAFSQAELELMDMENDLSEYEIIREKTSLRNAKERINEFGVDGMEARLYDKSRNWDSADVDAAMALIQTRIAEGDYSAASDLALELRERATVGGQLIQALAKYSRTAGGTFIQVENIVQQINKDFAKSLKKAGKETVEISEENRKKLLGAKTQAEMDAVLDDIANEVSAQLPATLAEKINSWRYMSMLGNVKTHVRNVAGNTFMAALREAKNVVGVGLEKIFVKDETQRTKALVNRRSEEGKALYDYAKSTLPDVEAKLSGNKESIKTGDKLRDKVAERRTIFGLKPVEAIRRFNEKALNFEDLEMFGKPAYLEAYASAMKARGLTPEIITAEQRSEIADIAVQEAMRTTFRDASALATSINKIENQNSVSKLLVGGLLPFKKTPINVLKRGVEYSPIGIIQGTTQLLTSVKNGKMTAAQAVDRISSGIVGTALFGLGMWLAKSGVLRAGGEDDENYEYYLKDLGYQAYSLKIGDGSFTIDWATPGTIPLFIGAELQGALEGSSSFSFNGILEALSETADPLVQLSMLQGVADAISAVGSEEGVSAIGELAFSSMQNYASQFVPSVFGQIARTVDPVRRSTTGDPNAALGAAPDKALRKMAAKIPGLSAVLEPYVDKSGELQDDTHWAVRLLENTLLPGYIEKVDMTNVDEEITRLYMQTERNDIFPKYVQRTLTLGGQRYTMTADEYTEYQQAVGKAVYTALDSVVTNPAYAALTDELKAQSLADAIKAAQDNVRAEYKAKFFVEPQS